MIMAVLAWLRGVLRPKAPDTAKHRRVIAGLRATPPVMAEARRRMRAGDPVTDLASGRHRAPRRHRTGGGR